MKKSILAGGTKSRNMLLLSIIIAISVGLMIYVGAVNKPILNGDELGSFISANQSTGNRLTFWSRAWYDGRLFTDAYSVHPGEQFGYGKVWANQAGDVHPPLWYAALHTVCSFFPGEFSKWFSLAVNILCIPFAIVLFYKSMLLLNHKNENFALMASFVYGVSTGTIKVVLFLRMYTMMQLWCMLILYLHLKSIKEEKLNWKDYLLLGIGTFLGTMTHYYFLAFLFILAVCFGIYLLKHKRFKETALYCVTMVITAVVSIVVYPAMLQHIFGGYRGDETINNLKGGLSGFFGAFKTISTEVLTDLFGNPVVGFLMLVAVIGYILIARVCKLVKHSERKTSSRIIVTVTTLVIYYLLIVKATPIRDFRYFAPVYPIIIMVVLLGLYQIAERWITNKKIIYVMVFLLAITPTSIYMINETPVEETEGDKISEDYKDCDAILALHDPADGVTNYIALSNYYQLKNYSKFYIIYETELDPIYDETIRNEKRLIVTIYNELNKDTIFKYLKDYTGLTKATYLYSGDEGNTETYLLEK